MIGLWLLIELALLAGFRLATLSGIGFPSPEVSFAFFGLDAAEEELEEEEEEEVEGWSETVEEEAAERSGRKSGSAGE